MSGEELGVPCQEPERSGLVDGDAWWQVLDRAEQAEARVVKLERALREIIALNTYTERLGYAQGIARRGVDS